MDYCKKEIQILNLDTLKEFSYKIALNLKGLEVIELVSDLGGGKTAFVRCLMENLKSDDYVSSPSFTIENIYRCSGFNIHHFDFYRLDNSGICGLELQEAIADPQAVVIVEWAEIVKGILPQLRLTIEFIVRPDISQDCRILKLKAPKTLEYLIENI